MVDFGERPDAHLIDGQRARIPVPSAAPLRSGPNGTDQRRVEPQVGARDLRGADARDFLVGERSLRHRAVIHERGDAAELPVVQRHLLGPRLQLRPEEAGEGSRTVSRSSLRSSPASSHGIVTA